MRALKTPSIICLVSLCLLVFQLEGQDTKGRRGHDQSQWLAIQDHLPDPATATLASLEQQGDLLRIRRFPEDALDYYTYAARRGGSSPALMNKIGLTQLELRNTVLAEGFFRQAIKLDKRNPQGWNNLAATEYLNRQYSSAVSDYKKAVKLDHSNAVFHANLSTAYFETKDYKRARREADEALKLDPLVFQHSNGAGVSAHILSVGDRARYAFEMAKLYADRGQEPEMLHALALACENGMDILPAMAKDAGLAKYRDDPRVGLLIVTAQSVKQGMPPLLANASPKTEGALQSR